MEERHRPVDDLSFQVGLADFGTMVMASSPSEGGSSKFDRRDMLIGLGGLYGVAGLASDPLASATPIVAPDLSKCHKLKDPPEFPPLDTADVKCCAPFSTKVAIDFTPSRPSGKSRIRPAAQWLHHDELAKYKKAVELMKALPEDDPRNFIQQAKVHCAYCNGAYDQVKSPSDQYIQAILLSLYHSGTGTILLATPFQPYSTTLPLLFTMRTETKLTWPPTIIDLNYAETDDGHPSKPPLPDPEQIASNHYTMYRQMVHCKIGTLFFGNPYRTGSPPSPGAGSIENVPHSPVHVWTGDSNRRANGEDMGHFYSAGRDPVFYSHHANVDRMWNIWKTLPGPKRVDISDPDYLNSSFVFYDENAQLVSVKVGDSLDSRKLGYVYEDVPIDWLKYKPKATKSKIVKMLRKHGIARADDVNILPLSQFPITLDKTVKTVVERPKKSRSKFEKEDEEEVLVIQGIDFANNVAVKFDVYINDEDDEAISGPEKSEFAGSFATVPHNPEGGHNIKTELNLGISELLEDIGADDDDKVVVTLVPKSGIVYNN
ncbi:hypothetical protein G4B88_022317 [Cannabis sativa]|uniref:Tyrosinase copper-binding domain-containing protein n=1 Tax=Cannabis sativa TaxID=3483 RepID=A0A7J6HV93_CANSA|nr:hypothetical protein G4B88_022317 [Cannabis sativa]